METIAFCENGLHVRFEAADDGAVRLMHFSALPYEESSIGGEDARAGFNLVEVQLSGQDRPLERHGTKYVVTAPGYRMRYKGHEDTQNETGRRLVITSRDEATGLEVESHFQFFAGLPLCRCHTVAVHTGDEAVVLEHLSCFKLNGVEKEGLLPQDEKLRLHIPHNSWQRELQWQRYTLPQLGLARAQVRVPQRSSKVVGASNVGSWSTKEYLPMGLLENTETHTSIFWQIEHNGSWHWEISDQTNHLYLLLSGPSETEAHWSRNLAPGDRFESVPVCVGASVGGFDEAMAHLTRYRRRIRRPNEDNERLPVIFNDYMNCLNADPTTAKELPLIDAAAACGCEIYCVDAGWYDDGYWWDSVGEWLPAKGRWPGGLGEVLDHIRARGMVPGLWLEIEVMGIHAPTLAQADDSWFFIRHGRRVSDRSRYQLDFRNPAVRAFATGVVRRLVEDYGVGYIKMDYNIEPGIGTEREADSFGDGALGHQRAYLAWVDELFAAWPGLIIENCSSGGLRMDYALLSRHSVQSTSDQEDYRFYSAIAANAPSALTPEQAAVWSYPLADGDAEETIYNMVNCLLLRIHQSGHLARLDAQRRALVSEGIACYKGIRGHIRRAVAYWPLGTAAFGDGWASLALRDGPVTLLAVWRQGGAEDSAVIPLPYLTGTHTDARCIYPEKHGCAFAWNPAAAQLSLRLEQPYMARLFQLTTTDGEERKA